MEKEKFHWWQRGIIYQVYPRSFQDSDGNGIGDLPGIIQRLDYLKELGITAIWLSPIMESPMADFGYDISDYRKIHPLFGTMADFDALLQQVHQRSMKLILDFVPNHTSDEHPWFKAAASSRTDPKHDWYLWAEPRPDGSVPNNWLSVFGGSAWEWNEHLQQYYYHAFLKKQPDLNWRNPQVQEAMFDIMRFWLDKGVDGFRVDVMWHLIKDAQLRDNPPNPAYQPSMSTYEQLVPVYSTDQAEVHSIVANMRSVLDEYEDRMMIGEIYLPINRLVSYYGTDNNGAHLPFNFLLISAPWHAVQIAAAVNEYEGALPEHGWPNWVLGNHDQSRIVSRIGAEQAKNAALLLLTLRGTPTIYYGEEIGMRDVPLSDAEIKDPQGLNMPDKSLSRDPARTPMQWDAAAAAGFTTGHPWLPVARNYKRNNVAVQQKDAYSMLAFYRKLIRLRDSEPSLATGGYVHIHATEQIMAYSRQAEGHSRFLIVLNFSHRACSFPIEHICEGGIIVLATEPELEGQAVNTVLSFDGDDGVIIRLAEATGNG